MKSVVKAQGNGCQGSRKSVAKAHGNGCYGWKSVAKGQEMVTKVKEMGVKEMGAKVGKWLLRLEIGC